MKINIVCIGKIKEKFFVEAINEYAKRLSRFCDLKIIEVEEESKMSNTDKKCEIESENLQSKCGGIIVALDSSGKLLSSSEIANFIKLKTNNGISEISFVIGGSNGLSQGLKNRADLVLSFGKITFPHQLFRVVLLEQIYRAFTILEGLPYHK